MSVMENTGKKSPRPRRSFTSEFKTEIVDLRSSLGHLTPDEYKATTATRNDLPEAA